ncbi:MAG: hypothetical protein K6C94_00295 [Candidatus Gastranaerophilales bacterium]|nr:hypothetical protein [Candidatus Gastranaerophilales bacterium]
MSKKAKIIISTILITPIVLILFCLFLYIYALPKIVSNPLVTEKIHNLVKESCNAEIIINKPVLKTSLKPKVQFTSENIVLLKDGETLLNLQNIDSEIDLSKIFSKKIILNRLGADEIYIDINKLKDLKTKEQENTNADSDFTFDPLNSWLYIKKCAIIYGSPKGVMVKLLAKDINLLPQKDEKSFLHFKILADTDYNNERLRVLLADKDNVYIKDNQLFIDDFKFKVNKSEINLTAKIDPDGKYTANVYSDKFELKNIEQLLNTNLVIPNGRDIMSCFANTTGDFKFNLDIDNDNVRGYIKVNTVKAALTPLANIPLTITNGYIKITPTKIKIEDFKGYYGKSAIQKVAMKGEVDDYTNTAKTSLSIMGRAFDELTKYISKIAGTNISLVNESKFAFKVNCDSTGQVEIKGLGKIPKGSNILFEGASISSDKYDRAVGIDLNIVGQDLNIDHINYYISEEISRKTRGKTKPIVTISGALNAYTGYLKELEFNVPEPLPSEFFNVLVGQKILRRGTFEGALRFINSKTPKIDGKMVMKGVFVSGQRFLIKNAVISANDKYINVTSDGTIRRTKYKFNGNIVNNLVFPIIIDNTNITVDEIDVEKVMQTFAPRQANAPRRPRPSNVNLEIPKSNVSTEYFDFEEKKTENENVEQIAFQPNLLVIKDCIFNVKKGNYKLINFSNLNAKLNLTKNGLLTINSNRFDFAEGISSLKVKCDLLKEIYSVALGTRNVDTNVIAASILNLDKEITGKASALMIFSTDSSAKLNGKIKFSVKDGSITKLGLVQYVLNMAAIFRNPIVMISPSTLVDLVNIPDGTFNQISGNLEIKNNIIEKMFIQSSSPQLSSVIAGQINLENMDTSLRIYTKFSNKNSGITGFLRNFSLSSLSKRTPFATKETASYYAAELAMLPKLEIGEDEAQVFLTKVDGDIQTNNFISSLKKIK